MSHKLDNKSDGPSPIFSTRIPHHRHEQLGCISDVTGVSRSNIGRLFLEIGLASVLGETDETAEAKSQVEKWLAQVVEEENPEIPLEVLQAGLRIHDKIQERRRKVVAQAAARAKKNSTSR